MNDITTAMVIFSFSTVSAQKAPMNAGIYSDFGEHQATTLSLCSNQSGFIRVKQWNYLKGLSIGAGIGGLAGGSIGALTYTECTDTGFMACFMHPESPGDAFLLGAFLGGIAGGVTGIIVVAVRNESRVQPHRRVEYNVNTVPVRTGVDEFTSAVSLKLKINY